MTKFNKAFTLAEVLVTLMIIGVIASITIPSLRKNTDQRENIAGMKKAYSTLSQAIIMSEGDNGSSKRWAYAGDSGAFYNNYLKPYLNTTKDCGVDEECFGDIIKNPNGNNYGAGYYKIIMADGSRWIFETNEADHTHVVIDVNGSKKPNIVGSDVFTFTITKTAFVDTFHNVSDTGVYYYGAGIPRADLLSICKDSGHTCGALIIMDGDKMTY